MSNIITTTGQAVIAAALANGTTIDIMHIALGSSARFPTGGETSLETEVYRDLVSESGLVAGSPNEAYFKFTVPEDGVAPGFNYGPWTAQEVGLFDTNGDLIVIGRFPEPLPKYDPASGSPNAINITIRVIFANIEAINVNYVPNFNLPWASDADALDATLENRIIDPKRLHSVLPGVIKSEILANKALTNLQQISIGARTLLTGIVGYAQVITGAFVKISPTSNVVFFINSPTLIPSGSTASPPIGRIDIDGNVRSGVISNSTPSIAKGQPSINGVIAGIVDGNRTFKYEVGREDLTAWDVVINPNQTDASWFPVAGTETTLLIGEIEP